jgi:hypothetical protein
MCWRYRQEFWPDIFIALIAWLSSAQIWQSTEVKPNHPLYAMLGCGFT